MMAQQAQKPQKSGLVNLAVDYGPVLVFFLAYRLLRPAGNSALAEVVAVTKSTIAFMVATVIALGVSKWKLGRISPMLWVTTALVIGFGLVTVVTQDSRYIRHKPTAVYLLFAAALLIGWIRNRPTLKILLESAFDGLSDKGWMILTRNWGLFFLFLAALNEVFASARIANAVFGHPEELFDRWLKAKLFVFLPLSFLFTFAHLPMLLRHGLAKDAKEEALSELPHE
jgi:intracellular septation protein